MMLPTKFQFIWESTENRVRSIRTFPYEKKNIFVKKQRILMNFHIISAYNSEISSELSEYSEKKLELSEYSEKNLELSELTSEKNWELSEYPEWPRKKFGIVWILRMTSEKNSELSELTSEKNSEFRIKFGNYHPYSENIVWFGNYSKLVRRKFPH